MEAVFGEKAIWYFVPIVGLAGAACGAVIGFMIPHACRANIVTPLDPNVAGELRHLRERAEAAFGDKIAAANWLFMPNNGLGGITPAEAVQYKTYATGVHTLLAQDAPHILDVAAEAMPIAPRARKACGCRGHAAEPVTGSTGQHPTPAARNSHLSRR